MKLLEATKGNDHADAYVIEVGGCTAGIVARDSNSHSFNFFSAARAFNVMEGQRFSDPLAAERMARMLAKNGSLLTPSKLASPPANRTAPVWLEGNPQKTYD